MDTIEDIVKKSKINSSSSTIIVSKPTSLGTLVTWNISKALEKNPRLDVKDAITLAQNQLEQVSDSHDIQDVLSEHPHTRYLACALLAWQQLGHHDADSLCRFVDDKRKEEERLKLTSSSKAMSPKIASAAGTSREFKFAKAVDDSSYHSNIMGPVVKLPVETKIVMRAENKYQVPRIMQKRMRTPGIDVQTKIDQACCLDSKCSERLLAMDSANAELRKRVVMLARRESERVELIERAETAWKDLEVGYLRKIALAEEKEDDIAKQIEKIMTERNTSKTGCVVLAQELTRKGEEADKERDRLAQIEKEIYNRACERHKLFEECARGEALVAEQACRASQIDRDLQFQEDQARRKISSLQSEADSASALAHEAERAMRAELTALRDQIKELSAQLLEEDEFNKKIKPQMEDLRQERMGLIEDLENCKTMCDGAMQGQVDELKEKTKRLAHLKEEVLECQCRVPVEISVEVKRTPSLAAMCKCSPEHKLMESCSCASIRTRLMSDLLSDLFGGLQTELGMSVTQMPCQLLKCLEDKHNWDKNSIVKNNLKDYFSRLLVGELDIAIATSIEKYHAKWMGLICADTVNAIKPEDGDQNEGWQERAIEKRAQKLASQLAEQLFMDRADQLTQRAKEIMASGPPPCQCKPPPQPDPEPPSSIETNTNEVSVLPCMMDNRPASKLGRNSATPLYWNHTMHDVTQLQCLGEDPTKDIPKKDDFKPTENKFHRTNPRAPAGHFPEKSFESERRLGKRLERRYDELGKARFNKSATLSSDSKANGMALNKATHKSAAKVAPDPVLPMYLHQTMHDVTQLRQQVEDLRKDALKKEDLKSMEDKLAKIIQRASESTASTNTRMDCFTSGNTLNEITRKELKINRAISQSGLPIIDLNKPSTSKKKNGDIGIQIKNRIKPRTSFKQRTDKPFAYKRNNTYAVNVCLLSSEKSKSDNTSWKQKASKDSQLSSKGQSNLTTASLFSEDIISARTNSKEFEDECSGNCACFHKIPSNISIDKLLETLAKWKEDLDASCNDNQTHKNNPNASKTSNKISQKSTGPMGTTESEYMGAVNLDKSNEDPCKCIFAEKFNKNIPFKCITSSKCVCDKNAYKTGLENINLHHQNELRSNIITTDPESLIKDGGTVLETRPEHEEQNTTSQKLKTSDYGGNENKKNDQCPHEENENIQYISNSNIEQQDNIVFTDDNEPQNSLDHQHLNKNKQNRRKATSQENEKVQYQLQEDNKPDLNNYKNNSQTRENEIIRKLDDKKIVENKTFCSNADCSYLVKFLGVTLADAIFPKTSNGPREKNDENSKYSENVSFNYATPPEEFQPAQRATSDEIGTRENYQGMNNSDYEQVSVTGFSKLSNKNILTQKLMPTQKHELHNRKNNNNEGYQYNDNIDNINENFSEYDEYSSDLHGGGRNIFMNKNIRDKYTNCEMQTCPIFKQIKIKGIRKGYNENEDYRNSNFVRDKDFGKTKDSFKPHSRNESSFDKATSDHKNIFGICENYRRGKCIASKTNLNNTESEISRNIFNATSENHPLYKESERYDHSNISHNMYETEAETLRKAPTASSERKMVNKKYDNENIERISDNVGQMERNINVTPNDKRSSKGDKMYETTNLGSRLNSAESGKIKRHSNTINDKMGIKTYDNNEPKYSNSKEPKTFRNTLTENESPTVGNKMYNHGEVTMHTDDKISKETSTLSQENKNRTAGKQMLTCQCSAQLDEFKKFVDGTMPKNNESEDVAIDAQNFKNIKDKDERCVCHIQPSTDETKELEENAFHLLEEYLRKKLEDFKSTSCSSSCIPPEEEEKLFRIIIQRVKQLISDSTNQISCKCSAEDRKSQGSWNRAYGLLQEYLRIKIKKIQCSCILVQDNNDTILPEVLGKVSHLIEYDFQRLKEVCGCKNDIFSQENSEKGPKVNFQASRGDQGHTMYDENGKPVTMGPGSTNHSTLLYGNQGIPSQAPGSTDYSYTNQGSTTVYGEQGGPSQIPSKIGSSSANQGSIVYGSQGVPSLMPSKLGSAGAYQGSVTYGNQIIPPQSMNSVGFVRAQQGSGMYGNQIPTSQMPSQMGFIGQNQGSPSYGNESVSPQILTTMGSSNTYQGSRMYGNQGISSQLPSNMEFVSANQSSTVYGNQGISPQMPFNKWPSHLNQDPMLYGDQSLPTQIPLYIEPSYANQDLSIHGYQGNLSQLPSKMGSTNANLGPTLYGTQGIPPQLMATMGSASTNQDSVMYGYQGVPSQIPSKMGSASANQEPTRYANQSLPPQTLATIGSATGTQSISSQIQLNVTNQDQILIDVGADPDMYNTVPEGEEIDAKVMENIHTMIDPRDQKSSQFPISNGDNPQYECPCECRCDRHHKLPTPKHTEIDRNLLIMKSQPYRSNIQHISYMINSKSVNTEQLTEAEIEEMKLKCMHSHIERQNGETELIKNDKNFSCHYLDCEQSYILCDANDQPKQSSVCIGCKSSTQQYNTTTRINQIDSDEMSSLKLLSTPTAPYVGYTVDCACSESLSVCVCTKSISKKNAKLVSSLWQTSLPNETYLKNVSYMVTNQPAENINGITDSLETSDDVCLRSILKKSATNNICTHNRCEATIDSLTEEEFVLKDSLDNVDRTNVTMTTNTFDDNTSVETDYSTNEDTLDWCECCSQYNPNKLSDTEKLKSSIFYPAPITDFDDRLKELMNDNSTNKNCLPKHVCECEMIPICHVKMLVENIETRLVNSKCTCDSLTPKVCPVHAEK